MRELKRIDVLLNEETEERFNNDDIVKITTTGTFRREYIGRIDWINTLELGLDMSKEYKECTTKIEYKDIARIEKLAV